MENFNSNIKEHREHKAILTVSKIRLDKNYEIQTEQEEKQDLPG
jgi:hypothetical protein